MMRIVILVRIVWSMAELLRSRGLLKTSVLLLPKVASVSRFLFLSLNASLTASNSTFVKLRTPNSTSISFVDELRSTA